LKTKSNKVSTITAAPWYGYIINITHGLRDKPYTHHL